MRIAAMVVVALSCAFYIFVLIQFTREQKHSKRKAISLTYLGTREESRASFPLTRSEQSSMGQNSPSKRKLVPIARRPAIKGVAPASQTMRNSNGLPYVELMLPVTAIVTPITTAGDETHSKLLRRRRA
jgi:hypothetical protein